MTEAEWLESDDPYLLLDVQRTRANDQQLPPRARARFSSKQVGLWIVACCRQNEELMEGEGTRERAAVEWAERVLGSAIECAEAWEPSDADPYRMGAAAYRCLSVAHCVLGGDDAVAVSLAREALELLLDVDAEPYLLFCDLLRDIVGNPFRPVTFFPSWRTSTAVTLASQMYESREFGAMPILADALQDAGCDNADALDHCRGPGPHVRGCWVVDMVLGKE
ncbi:hypothetical protein VT84_23965 [Gemmata sp. SH-PL17]|uniref:hypothetical protein n=1 Tax=Gemmata sp. SH-PL17 TaxID=1630693 RepID=UPI00078DD63E|nr:hypothetical protein [Gemmata sp. SH-PL17]AMV27478.1 hypothetical protein VT84_23965 [Gemmata sp. SH-PL17]